MLNAENQLIIAKHLAAKAAAIPECGHVLLPVYFNDKQDFQASIGSVALVTQKQLETSLVAYTVISYLNFEDVDDDLAAGGAEEGAVVKLNYGFEIFRERTGERLDESPDPDDFHKKVLRTYQDFVAAIVNLREEFRGSQPVTGLPPGVFAEAETASLVQDDLIRRNEESEYVPGVRGFAAELRGTVDLVYAEC